MVLPPLRPGCRQRAVPRASVVGGPFLVGGWVQRAHSGRMGSPGHLGGERVLPAHEPSHRSTCVWSFPGPAHGPRTDEPASLSPAQGRPHLPRCAGVRGIPAVTFLRFEHLRERRCGPRPRRALLLSPSVSRPPAAQGSTGGAGRGGAGRGGPSGRAPAGAPRGAAGPLPSRRARRPPPGARASRAPTAQAPARAPTERRARARTERAAAPDRLGRGARRTEAQRMADGARGPCGCPA